MGIHGSGPVEAARVIALRGAVRARQTARPLPQMPLLWSRGQVARCSGQLWAKVGHIEQEVAEVRLSHPAG